METYSFLRYLADSWVLLILTGIFLGVIVWAFRPGSRAMHDDAAAVPFRHDDDTIPPRHRATGDVTKGQPDV
ncbi:cbb3-type cytochrome c oxidase subunit 3 [Oceaniglobus indicus]|uniref:cbb3-type cytochrome c oxidase subunit 3 n=1 Tax=Oceaniglobus indicus TaxID=2047749 RepID=UPI000C1A418D|nr:cbb3-type cytochrome c oxidase subunit 3 [Oceaniglobus indicus]